MPKPTSTPTSPSNHQQQHRHTSRHHRTNRGRRELPPASAQQQSTPTDVSLAPPPAGSLWALDPTPTAVTTTTPATANTRRHQQQHLPPPPYHAAMNDSFPRPIYPSVINTYLEPSPNNDIIRPLAPSLESIVSEQHRQIQKKQPQTCATFFCLSCRPSAWAQYFYLAGLGLIWTVLALVMLAVSFAIFLTFGWLPCGIGHEIAICMTVIWRWLAITELRWLNSLYDRSTFVYTSGYLRPPPTYPSYRSLTGNLTDRFTWRLFTYLPLIKLPLIIIITPIMITLIVLSAWLSFNWIVVYACGAQCYAPVIIDYPALQSWRWLFEPGAPVLAVIPIGLSLLMLCFMLVDMFTRALHGVAFAFLK